MLPNRCSIRQNGRQCPNPPEFIVTVTSRNNDEYMLGVTCGTHRQSVLAEVRRFQNNGRIEDGKVGFTPLKPVGTDCIKGDPDDLVQIGASPCGNMTKPL